MPQPMRVGINSLFLIPKEAGGITTYLHNLLQELPPLDDNIDYTLFMNREMKETFPRHGTDGINKIACPVSAAQRVTRLAYEHAILPIQARRRGINVLFSAGFTTPIHPGCASVVAIYDMRHEDRVEDLSPGQSLAIKYLVRQAARSASHILTLSEHAKSRIVDVYKVSPKKVTVSYLAPGSIYFERVSTTEVARVRKGYGLYGPYILSVATLHPHKNLDTLIDAFRTLRQMMETDVQLALVGLRGNAAAALDAKIRAEGLERHVVLTGWVPDADLPILYQGAEVFVFPSRYEGFGIPVLEAMASGTPVITTTATSLPEVAGDAALLVDPDDRAALTQALRHVLDDPALRTDLIGRGKARAPLFTWRKTAEATASVLRAAVRR